MDHYPGSRQGEATDESGAEGSERVAAELARGVELGLGWMLLGATLSRALIEDDSIYQAFNSAAKTTK